MKVHHRKVPTSTALFCGADRYLCETNVHDAATGAASSGAVDGAVMR